MIYVFDLTAAEMGDEPIRSFSNLTEAAETLLDEYYEVRSNYGNPIKSILRHVSEEGQKSLLYDLNYLVGSSEEEVITKFKRGKR